MEYRKLPGGSEKISILGLGNSSLGQAGEKEAQAAVELAIENGINYFDMAAAGIRYIFRFISARIITPEPMAGP